MEPADKRRDDLDRAGMILASAHQPQWSPPLNGGTTAARVSKVSLKCAPQWSPPLNGGTTHHGGPAMVELAVPQWSPPLNGGTTGREIRAV